MLKYECKNRFPNEELKEELCASHSYHVRYFASRLAITSTFSEEGRVDGEMSLVQPVI